MHIVQIANAVYFISYIPLYMFVTFMLPNQSTLKGAWRHVTQCLMTCEIDVGPPFKMASGQDANQYRLPFDNSWYYLCWEKKQFGVMKAIKSTPDTVYYYVMAVHNLHDIGLYKLQQQG